MPVAAKRQILGVGGKAPKAQVGTAVNGCAERSPGVRTTGSLESDEPDVTPREVWNQHDLPGSSQTVTPCYAHSLVLPMIQWFAGSGFAAPRRSALPSRAPWMIPEPAKWGIRPTVPPRTSRHPLTCALTPCAPAALTGTRRARRPKVLWRPLARAISDFTLREVWNMTAFAPAPRSLLPCTRTHTRSADGVLNRMWRGSPPRPSGLPCRTPCAISHFAKCGMSRGSPLRPRSSPGATSNHSVCPWCPGAATAWPVVGARPQRAWVAAWALPHIAKYGIRTTFSSAPGSLLPRTRAHSLCRCCGHGQVAASHRGRCEVRSGARSMDDFTLREV